MTIIAMNITIVAIISIGLRGTNTADSNTNIINTIASDAIFPRFFTFTLSFIIFHSDFTANNKRRFALPAARGTQRLPWSLLKLIFLPYL